MVPQVRGGIVWMVDLVKEMGHEGLGRHGQAFGSWTYGSGEPLRASSRRLRSVCYLGAGPGSRSPLEGTVIQCYNNPEE